MTTLTYHHPIMASSCYLLANFSCLTTASLPTTLARNDFDLLMVRRESSYTIGEPGGSLTLSPAPYCKSLPMLEQYRLICAPTACTLCNLKIKDGPCIPPTGQINAIITKPSNPVIRDDAPSLNKACSTYTCPEASKSELAHYTWRAAPIYWHVQGRLCGTNIWEHMACP